MLVDGFVVLWVVDDCMVWLFSFGGVVIDCLLLCIVVGIDVVVDEVVVFWGIDWLYDIFVVVVGSDE